ncbi:PBPRA1643 family SWIM/SEC-C metal-binding motif protein [Enterovibrio baiacu]|uniref:PBPRA1643 family SWIM/SEC-C metal-binding motif protein n=1 Tax=Enterovibrio baiacu TaxID=2491023 RepID=UPI0010121B1B|nr:PBPRA1643 family SWIM/SEC-C metal-binding motif protein [Enterovibrio baiacu]MBE1276530.1 zinc chelation protein SecC [Enterovibrio baiacu]
MSKFFYKGRIEKKPKYESFGYNTKRSAKPGSEDHPLSLNVQTEERKAELEAIALENKLFANIVVDAEKAEDITELETYMAKPQTTTFEKTPNRNDPCSCGSEKKYKKCCGK